MARIPVDGSNGTFIKWAEVEKGTEFEGIFRGMREGKFGLLADLETADESLTLPVAAALERPLARVRVGAGVVIVYTGMAKSAKTGKPFHTFEVFVTDTKALLPAPARRQRASATDELSF